MSPLSFSSFAITASRASLSALDLAIVWRAPMCCAKKTTWRRMSLAMEPSASSEACLYMATSSSSDSACIRPASAVLMFFSSFSISARTLVTMATMSIFGALVIRFDCRTLCLVRFPLPEPGRSKPRSWARRSACIFMRLALRSIFLLALDISMSFLLLSTICLAALPFRFRLATSSFWRSRSRSRASLLRTSLSYFIFVTFSSVLTRLSSLETEPPLATTCFARSVPLRSTSFCLSIAHSFSRVKACASASWRFASSAS
mmetsp:Transcript_7360/g.31266  ORF Transcript_7360/g.31266 Transcript_7360/m.31266 type:complete len:260 (+) Transcript_7360:468-1247(+)